eukprot:9471903-Pyramimonas_sp.AAC.1
MPIRKLKPLLRDCGLSVEGKKTDLVERLMHRELVSDASRRAVTVHMANTEHCRMHVVPMYIMQNPSADGPVTKEEVLACQAAWAKAIKTISKSYLEKGDYIGAAGEAAGELYAYGHSDVLFKPTKAAEVPFRPSGEEAMSYFVGGSAVP